MQPERAARKRCTVNSPAGRSDSNAGTRSCGDATRRMPAPPHPTASLSISGKPMRAAASSSPTRAGSVTKGGIGIPAASIASSMRFLSRISAVVAGSGSKGNTPRIHGARRVPKASSSASSAMAMKSKGSAATAARSASTAHSASRGMTIRFSISQLWARLVSAGHNAVTRQPAKASIAGTREALRAGSSAATSARGLPVRPAIRFIVGVRG